MKLSKSAITASLIAMGMASVPAFAITITIDTGDVDTDVGAVVPGSGDTPDLSSLPELDPNTLPIGPGVPGTDDITNGIPVNPTMSINVPGNLEIPQTCAGLGITPNLNRGAVFWQVNSPSGSTLETYDRDPQTGRICHVSSQPTMGVGDTTGIVTSAQNNVVNLGSRCVYVANPGGDPTLFPDTMNMHGTVSAFKINRDDVQFVGIYDTHGPNPRALSIGKTKFMYVVNGGVGAGLFGPNVSVIRESIFGWEINRNTCALREIPGSLNVTNDHEGDPGDLNWTVDGKHLIVAQRRTTFAFGSGLEPSNAEVFPVFGNNTTGTPVVTDIQEQGPFGFRTYEHNGEQRSVHTHGNFQLIAAGGTSSWVTNPDSTMSPQTTSITGDDSPNVIENGGSDTCWNVLSHDNRWTYTSAFFDSALQAHQIALDGSLSPSIPAGGPGGISSSSANGHNANMYSVDQGGLDMARTDGRFANQFVYVMNNPVPPPVGAPVASVLPLKVTNGVNGGFLQPMENFRIVGLPSNSHGLAAF